MQMQKLGLVITEESLNQFQNYKNGQQALLPELPGKIFGSEGGMSSSAPGTPGTILGFQQQIAGILLGSGQQQTSSAQIGAVQNQAALGEMTQNQAMQNLSVSNIDAAQGVIIMKILPRAAGTRQALKGMP